MKAAGCARLLNLPDPRLKRWERRNCRRCVGITRAACVWCNQSVFRAGEAGQHEAEFWGAGARLGDTTQWVSARDRNDRRKRSRLNQLANDASGAVKHLRPRRRSAQHSAPGVYLTVALISIDEYHADKSAISSSVSGLAMMVIISFCRLPLR